MEFLFHKFGYLAVFVGTILEGGTLLSMGGFAAHQGYMVLVPWVILAGFVGSFVDSQVWYFMGRSKGAAIVEKRPKWKPRLKKTNVWLRRYHTWFIIVARFIPGFRTVSSLAIGMSGVPLGRFVLLNAIGALLWASIVAISGFVFGRISKMLLGDIKHLEVPILCGIAVAGVAICIFLHYRERRQQE